MIFNVSGLLNGSIGEELRFHFADESLERDGVVFAEVEARGKLMRTDRTVLAQARVKATNEAECARCLNSTTIRLELEFAEEFEPTNVDLVVRRRTWLQDDEIDDEALRIDDGNVLDLSYSLWQSLSSAMPMRPLCTENCLGLCPECATNLNLAPCRCPQSIAPSNVFSRLSL